MKKLSFLFFLFCLAGCKVNQNPANEKMYTGYINNVKTQADIENNRRVEHKWSNIAPLYCYKTSSPEYKKADDTFVATVLKSCKCDSVQAGNLFAFKAWTVNRQHSMD